VLEWDADGYVQELGIRPTGRNETMEAAMSETFPPAFAKPLPMFREPLTIVDAAGHILAWYLPRLFSQIMQVS
jgi:hypothetical protein